jgi:hypothetical protein
MRRSISEISSSPLPPLPVEAEAETEARSGDPLAPEEEARAFSSEERGETLREERRDDCDEDSAPSLAPDVLLAAGAGLALAREEGEAGALGPEDEEGRAGLRGAFWADEGRGASPGPATPVGKGLGTAEAGAEAGPDAGCDFGASLRGESMRLLSAMPLLAPAPAPAPAPPAADARLGLGTAAAPSSSLSEGGCCPLAAVLPFLLLPAFGDLEVAALEPAEPGAERERRLLFAESAEEYPDSRDER